MDFSKKKSIKFKLFGVFIILLAILAGNSIWSIFNFYDLRESIDNIMTANYNSVVAAQNMTVALERQDSAELAYLFELNEESVESFKENEIVFLKWFARAEDNITEEGETEILADINNYYQEYSKGFTELTGGSVDIDYKSYYYQSLFPMFQQVKSSCHQLLLINQESMVRHKGEAEITARNATYSTLVISIFTILFGLVVAYYLTGRIVNPLHTLIDRIKKISEGDYSQKILVKGEGEIAELADEFNSMTDKLKYYELLNIEKLVKEKKKAEAVIESISDGIIITDNENKIILLNKAAERIFNLKERQIQGKHFLEVIKQDKIMEIINKVKDKSGGNEYKKYFDFSIGEEDKQRHYRVNVTPIFGREEKSIGIITLIQDITKLKEIDNMKSDFISKVSHEFRTPLTSISMAVGLLLDKVPGKVNKDQKELLTTIKQDEERLANLVDELLDLSRIESGKVKMDIAPCDVKKIVKKAVDSLAMQAEEKKIKIKVSRTKKMPKVKADFNKITWVLTNLIGNSLRYVPTDGSGLIEIKFKEWGKLVMVSVSDNGEGISEDYQKVIFDKFVQVDDKNQKEKGGAGLGLAISKEIIDAHGGDIWVKSELKKGSTFYFTLHKA